MTPSDQHADEPVDNPKTSTIPQPFRPGSRFGRHLVSQRLEPATGDLPPVAQYRCRRKPAHLGDQAPDAAAWDAAEWSEPFSEICNEDTTVVTRIAMMWDDTNLYVSFKVSGPHRAPLMNSDRDHVYVADDSVELFIEGTGHYYEIGRNSANIGYEVRWVWLEHLVNERDFACLESWITTQDFIFYRRRSGEPIGRIGDMDYALPGLTTQVDSEHDSPTALIDDWTATMTLPFSGLAAAVGGTWPPIPGDRRRIAGYRIHHGTAEFDPEQPAEQQVWSVMGNRDIHNPERWTVVTFVGDDMADAPEYT